ncbi:hypothetical protein K502DRAFT_347065 [Neoconidiobolus thromboides FSU 785]|nr:hypothetical protein K502DRAFT_347065 [Neoconidiobolus thromboides FSU 785]
MNLDDIENSIQADSNSIWIPTQIDDNKIDTHLTSTSSLNELNKDPLLHLKDKKLELQANLTHSTEIVTFNLFTSFTKLAEEKIDLAMAHDLKLGFRISDLVGKGKDENLDSILYSLGSVSRQNPSLLTDSILTWQNIKCSAMSIKELRRQSRSQALLMDRINLTVKYLSLRVLLEMLKQIKQTRSLDKAGNALEELAFSILKTFTPQMIAESNNHQVLYKLLGQFIKVLSSLRFSTLSDRFIALLEQIPETQGDTILDEDNLTLTIYTMKYLKLKIYPDDALEETSEFLLSIATFFRKTSHTRLKSAYAEAFVEMLLPIVQLVDAEVNFPILVKAVEVLDTKASKLLLKTRNYDISLPLMTSVIGLSQKELFLNKWISFFDLCCQKVKEKNYARNGLACLSRILWVYLFRYVENSTITQKRLDNIFRQLFSVNPKRQLIIYEGPTTLHYYYIIYYIASYDLDYFLTNWYNLLLQLDHNQHLMINFMDTLLPDRFTLCLRALLLLVDDHINSIKVPTFPQNIDFNFNNPTKIIIEDEKPKLSNNYNINFQFNTKILNLLQLFEDKLQLILPALEISYGSMLLTEEKYLSNKLKLHLNSPNLIDNNNININNNINNSSNSNNSNNNNSSNNINNNISNINNSFLSTSKETLNDMVKHPYNELSTMYIIYSKDKQSYFDLITAWLDSIPLLIPSNYTITKVIDWIIKLLYHIDPQISSSAGLALKRLCQLQNSYLLVLRCFSRSLKNIHVQFTELIAPIYTNNNNNTKKEKQDGPNLLNIFVELLNCWLEYLNNQNNNQNNNKIEMDNSSVWNLIEEIEALGILFLCSPIVSCRKGSFEILQLISKIEKEFSKFTQNTIEPRNEHLELDHKLIYNFLMSSRADKVITEALTSKKFTNKFLNKVKSLSIETLYQAATGEEKEHQILWNFVLPKLSKLLLDISPVSIVLCRHMVSYKLKYLHPFISQLSERNTSNESSTSLDIIDMELFTTITTSDDLLLAHYGQYLSFICSTITLSLDSKPEPSYRKKESKSTEGINSAKDLFRLVLVLLSCENKKIRSMIVTSLCHINHNIYRLFIEDLQPFMRLVQEDTKARMLAKDFKSIKKQDMFREGLTQCLAITADILQDEEYLQDYELANKILEFLKDVFQYLSQPEVQLDWKHQELRIYFCELGRKLYTKLSLIKDSNYSMSFETRLNIFQLAEKWCGHGQFRNSTREREVLMMQSVLEQYSDVIQRGAKTVAMEDLRKSLEISALNLMAILCKGSIISNPSLILSENNINSCTTRNSLPKNTFNLANLFGWLEAILLSPDKKLHPIAKLGLGNLLNYNLDHPLLFEKVLHHCYAGDPLQESTKAYFLALGKILTSSSICPITTAKKLALICFKIGDSCLRIRTMACKMLRQHYISDKGNINSKLDYLSELIIHPLAAIYENARFKICDQLAVTHPDLVLEIFSEIIMRLPNVLDASVRTLLKSLTSWTKELQLSLEPYNQLELTPISHAIITNLLYLVVKYSSIYPNEIELLWKQLFYSSNNQKALPAIVKCLIQLNIEKRNPSLVFFTKNIFVYLSHTSTAQELLDFLIEQLTPNSMIPKKKVNSSFGWERYKELSLPFYIANLDEMILTHTKRPAYSKGQLLLIFISDMILAVNSFSNHLPLLLHLGACQAYDNGLLPISNQDLAQPILPNLLLGLLNSSQRDTKLYDEIERIFSNFLNSKLLEKKEVLKHSAQSSLYSQFQLDTETQESSPLINLVQNVIEIFSLYVPDLMDPWCDLASTWATSCPIRSVAKASFKIYRSFSLPLQPKTLIDILSRLSGTISDLSPDIQNFVDEILNSLEIRLKAIPLSEWLLTPPLFWFLCGSLNSYNELEYLRNIKLLKWTINQLDNKDIYGLSIFLGFLPDQLYLSSIEDALLIGFSSGKASSISLELLYQFTLMPLSELIIDINKVYLAIILYCLPYLISFTSIDGKTNITDRNELNLTIDELLQLCESCECFGIYQIIQELPNKNYRNEEICLRQLLQEVRKHFFPDYEKEAIKLILKSLCYEHPIFITKRRLKLIKLLLAIVHPDHVKFSKDEPDLLLPLLSLINRGYNEEVLEVIEDILSINSFINNNNNNKFGLWKIIEEKKMNNNNENDENNENNENNTNNEDNINDKDLMNLFEGKHGLKNKWAVPITENQQQCTRQLLSCISKAALEYLENQFEFNPNESIKVNITQEFKQSNLTINEEIVDTFGHKNNSNLIQPSFKFQQNELFQPPKMTDFYTDQSSIHNHQRNHSSTTSILDYYGFKNGPLADLNELNNKLQGLEGYFE